MTRDDCPTVVPAGFKITKLPARVAKGAHKPRYGGGGAAQPTSAIAQSGDRRAIKDYAYKFNRKG